MSVISNFKVYGLENSIRVSKFPMAVDASKCTEEITSTQFRLAQSKAGSGEDNLLCGIVCQFDLSFTVKAWTEAERYHFFDIVSSQSTMHRIAKMNYDTCFNEYVTEETKNEMKHLLDIYNDNPTADNYLRLLYNCPTGLILTAGITTNYRQLKTILSQRWNHRLPEWRSFCREICELAPYPEMIHPKWVEKGDGE